MGGEWKGDVYGLVLPQVPTELLRPSQYVRACCVDGARRAGTKILVTWRQSEVPRLEGMKTRRRAVAVLNAHFEPAMLQKRRSQGLKT